MTNTPQEPLSFEELIERLEKVVERQGNQIINMHVDCAALETQLTAARAQIEAMKEALEPFQRIYAPKHRNVTDGKGPERGVSLTWEELEKLHEAALLQAREEKI